jgi:hypothetical protein
MDNDDRRLIANGTLAFAMSLTVGITAWVLMPAMQHATAAGPLYLKVAWVSLLAGAVAGLVVWGVCTLLQRSQAIAYAVVVLVGVFAANVALAGWVHVMDAVGKATGGLLATNSFSERSSYSEYRRQVVADRTAYKNALDKQHYPMFLSFKALEAPGGFKIARDRIVTVRGVIQTYQDRFQAQEIALRASFIGAAKTAQQQRAGMDRLKKIVGPELKDREDWWQAMSDLAAEQDAFLTDLANASAAWEFKDDKLFLHSRKDVTRFQTHAAAIKALQDKVHALDLKLAHESDQADEAMMGNGL